MTITQETFELLKFTGAGYEPKDIFNSAKTAAVKAVDEYMEGKEEPGYCGFANISIRPARGAFVKFLKDNKIGGNGWNGGYRVSYYDIMPQEHRYRNTQSMDIKELGCDAFCAALEKYGIRASMESRAD
jgi:hypothetical protein